jgi:hypothetical protein
MRIETFVLRPQSPAPAACDTGPSSPGLETRTEMFALPHVDAPISPRAAEIGVVARGSVCGGVISGVEGAFPWVSPRRWHEVIPQIFCAILGCV